MYGQLKYSALNTVFTTQNSVHCKLAQQNTLRGCRIALQVIFAISGIFAEVGMSAQETVYNSYALSEGLMSQTVYCAMQSEDGYMWFGTDAGVFRFDGTEFKNFTTDDGLCDNEVLRINQDSQKRIWFLSLSGCLAYYSDGQIHSAINDVRLTTNVKTLGTTCFAEDKRGNVWFAGMDTRIVKFDGNKTDLHSLNEALIDGVKTNIYMFHDLAGELFFIDYARLGVYTDKGQMQITENPYGRPLQNCFYYGNKKAYGLVEDGLYDFQAKGLVDFPALKMFPDLNIAMGLAVNESNIWISSSELGVYHWFFENGEWKFDKRYFTNDWINMVYEDDEHNLWFCTRDHGVYCIFPQRRDQFFFGLDEPYEATAFASSSGFVFFGTSHGEIFKLDKNSNSGASLLFDFEMNESIEDMVVDENNNLYVRTAGEGFVFFNCEGKATHLTTLRPKVIYNGDDGRLYMSTLSGIGYFEKKAIPGADIQWLKEIPGGRIYNICLDEHGRIWYENHDKLFYLENHTLHEAKAFNKFSRGRISSILKTKGGGVLVATMGSGLYLVKASDELSTFSRENGLPSNECEWIRMFGEDVIVLTSAGLVRLTLKDNAFQLQHHYGTTDGLPNAKIYDVLKRDSTLYLATHKGVFVLPFQTAALNAKPPRVIIKQVTGNGTVQPKGEVRLAYGENLKIDFGAIAFDMPDAISYQYTFDQAQSNWTVTSNRSVEIGSLPWGKHVFYVRAKKYDSGWSEPAQCSIEVLPPIWATWWFRGAMAVALAGIVYILFAFLARRKYNRKLLKLEQEQALLKERNRISTDLHDDIGAELSNIVILSRIAGSQLNANKNPGEYIKKIDGAASEVISKMNGIIWSLNPSNDHLESLVDYIRRYVQDFLELNDLSGSVEVTGEIDKSEIKALVRRNTFLIVKEALHNVRKHAHASRVDVRIKVVHDLFRIEIEDNGVGFENLMGRPDGLGLNSMKKRANDLSGFLEIKSTKGTGTLIALKIPKTV